MVGRIVQVSLGIIADRHKSPALIRFNMLFYGTPDLHVRGLRGPKAKKKTFSAFGFVPFRLLSLPIVPGRLSKSEIYPLKSNAFLISSF